jgi:hypothetical protein
LNVLPRVSLVDRWIEQTALSAMGGSKAAGAVVQEHREQ